MVSKKCLRLALPGALWSTAMLGSRSFNLPPSTERTTIVATDDVTAQSPNLTRLLGNSSAPQRLPAAQNGWSSWLMAQLCSVSLERTQPAKLSLNSQPANQTMHHWLADAPFACVQAAQLGLPTTGAWVRADPVVLEVGREDAELAMISGLDISAQEAEALLATLNEHFAQDGLRFYAFSARQWVLHIAQPQHDNFSLHCVDPWAGLRVPQRFVALSGNDASLARRWLNEAQMLFYTHPVNALRLQQGKPAINSLWFWASSCAKGADFLPHIAPQVAALLSSCQQALALGKALGLPHEIVAAAESSQPTQTLSIAYYPDLMSDFLSGKRNSWLNTLAKLDHAMIAPFITQFDEIEITLGGQTPQCTLTYQKPRGWNALMQPLKQWRQGLKGRQNLSTLAQELSQHA